MLLFLFGILDILAAIQLILLKFNISLSFVPWALAIYTILKSLIFIKAFVSWIDLAAGVVFVFALLGVSNALIWIAAFWLLQKGFFSFLR